MSAWEAIRARWDRGEPVTLDELGRAIAETPIPDDLLDAELVPARPVKRPRGRPHKWSDRDVDAIRTLCANARLWSEILTTTDDGYCTPLPLEEIRRRVGARLKRPMSGKSLENLLRRYPRRKGCVLARYTVDDYRRVLR